MTAPAARYARQIAAAQDLTQQAMPLARRAMTAGTAAPEHVAVALLEAAALVLATGRADSPNFSQFVDVLAFGFTSSCADLAAVVRQAGDARRCRICGGDRPDSAAARGWWVEIDLCAGCAAPSGEKQP